jgi:hypothetical protein
MEYFAREFRKSRGQSIEYMGKTLFLVYYFPVPIKSAKLRYRILSTNSDWKQGISLSTKGVLIYKNNMIKKGWADIWAHLMP